MLIKGVCRGSPCSRAIKPLEHESFLGPKNLSLIWENIVCMYEKILTGSSAPLASKFGVREGNSSGFQEEPLTPFGHNGSPAEAVKLFMSRDQQSVQDRNFAAFTPVQPRSTSDWVEESFLPEQLSYFFSFTSSQSWLEFKMMQTGLKRNPEIFRRFQALKGSSPTRSPLSLSRGRIFCTPRRLEKRGGFRCGIPDPG